MDIIEIDNLRLRCMIGFSSHERKDKQDVVISLRLGTDMQLAGETDKPDDAFNYRTVTKAIIQFVEKSDYFLVEKLATEIARICVVDHSAPYVQVRVHKPGALRFSDTVGVVIERTATDFDRPMVYVSLGSNIDPEKNLGQAIHLLKKQTTVLTSSSIYVTPPQGYTEQADFHNMAVKLITTRTPAELKTEVLDKIEHQLGRVRDPKNKNAPRTIDLDISLWEDQVFEYGERASRVPDEDIIRFAHVVIPLAEIAPEYVHPTENQPLKEVAARFSKDDIRRIDAS